MKARISEKDHSKDEVRELILKYLYEKHKKSRSLEKMYVSKKEIKNALKKYGLKESEIMSNLDYLIQSGWVIVDRKKFNIPTKSGKFIERESERFKISDVGIDYFEGTSKFQRIDTSLRGINLNNIDGIVILGNNNVVINKNYEDLYKFLEELRNKISISDKFSDEEKLNLIKDIDTIKDQLSKTKPDKSVIKIVWEKLLKKLKDIGIFLDIIDKISSILENFLSS